MKLTDRLITGNWGAVEAQLTVDSKSMLTAAAGITLAAFAIMLIFLAYKKLSK